MDYFSMKRKELQALCKEHNIPANSANSVLAQKLSQLLNEKEKPVTRKRACLKSSVETTNEDEPAVSKREVKKVRFSPNNDVAEYEVRSGKKHVATPINTRRKSVATKVDKVVVDSDSTNELIDDSVQIPIKRVSSRAQGRGAVRDVVKETNLVKEPEVNLGKVTRSKANILAKGNVVQPEESKQSKRPVKDVKKGSESVEETAVGRVRATRSKAQAVTDDSMGLDVNPQVKKTRGRQVAKDVQNVEPSDELMEIPARVTRSRQISNEDINNVVSNPKAEKKRTRRDMKATDESSNLSNVAPEDKQEHPKRKSSRTRGVENMDEDEGDKGEVVIGGRATRAKAQLAVNSGRDGKSRAAKKVVVPMEPKIVQKPEEPVKKAGGKNVNRRKSVMPSKNSEVVLHPEEPVNRRTRNTRSKSVIPEAQEEVSDEPEMAGSPAVEKKQAKGKSVDVTKAAKVASELKTVVNTTGSPKSRKRRGTPVTEDQGIGTDYGTVADESARRATRSAGKSEGKSAANKQAASVKTPTSGIGKQSAVKGELSEGNQRGTRQALRSGAATRGDSSNKRAKLSAPKQSDAEYSATKSNKKGTHVSKLNFEPDEKVVETELTPAIGGSRSQITRSAIRSDKTAGSLKKPSRTSVKKQPIGDAQTSTRKAARFRPDPAVNTAPGRVTRSGIKDRGSASSYYAEKVEKKKPSRSAHKVQPLDDAQISSPEVAEASPNPDVDTLGVQSEVHNEENMVSGNTGDLSIPEMRLPTKVVEENVVSVSETTILVESISTVLGENSGAEPHSISNGSDAEARDVGEGMEVADASIEKSSIQFTRNVAKPETGATPCLTENLLSGTQQKPLDLPGFGDEPLLVPNLSETPLQPLSEAEVQIAVNSEKSDVNEMDSAETGSVLKGQQTDVMVEEQVVSIEKTVVMEDNAAGVSLGDAENERDLGSHNIDSSAHDSFQQPDVMSTKEAERPVEPSNIENGSDGRASAPTPLPAKLVSEDNDDTLDQATDDEKLQGIFSAENDIKDGMDAAHGSLMEPNVLPAEENITSDDVADNDDTLDQATDDEKLQGIFSAENDIKDGMDAAHDSLMEPNVLPAEENITSDDVADNDDTLDQATDDEKLQGIFSAENDIKDGMDAAHGSLMEPNVLPAEENITSDDVADNDDTLDQATDDEKLQGIFSAENDIKDGMDAAHGSLMEPNVLPAEENITSDDVADNDDTLDQATDDEKLQGIFSAENDIKDGMDAAHGSLMEPNVLPAEENITSDDVADNDDTLDQATDDEKLQGIFSAENDIKDGMDAAHGSLMEPNVLPAEENITSDDVADVSVDAGDEPAKELESDIVQSTGTDVHQSPILGRSDDENDSPIFGKPNDESDGPVLGKFDGEDTQLVSEDNDVTLDQATDDDKLQSLYSAENDIKDGMDVAHGSLMEPNVLPAEANITSDDVAHGKPDDESDGPILGKFDGEDANVNSGKECETDEGLNSEHLLQDPVLSGGDGDAEGVSTNHERESNPKLNNNNDVSDTSLGQNDDFNMTEQPEPTSEPSSFNDITETPYSANDISVEDQKAHLKPLYGNDVFGTPVKGEDDVLVDAGNEPTKELESDAVASTDSDVPNVGTSGDENESLIFGTSVSQKFDGEDANVNECESDEGVNSNKEHLHQETALSGGEDDDVNTNNEHESDQTLVTGNDDVIPISVIGEDDVKDDTISVHKELETGLEPSNDYETLEVHVSGNVVDSEYVVDDQGDEQDGESERDKLASNDSPDMDEQYVGGDDLEPENNENMPAMTEILNSSSHQESVPESNIARGKVTCYTAGVSNSVGPSDLSMSTEAPPTPATSGDEVASVTVDVLEESLPNINKDVVANIFGDIYGLGSTEVTDINNDSGNEQITIGTSENIEGVSKESESVYPGMSDEQITEETNTTKDIDHVSISDHCLDGGSNLGVDEFDTQLVGDIDNYDYPTREGSPSIVFTQEFSASPTSSEENDRSKQGETQKKDTCQGLGDYSFRVDEQKSISVNESYVLDESRKDNQVLDINTSAIASYFKGSSSSAAGLVDSVKNFDKASGHMTEGKSTQVDVMKENPNPNMNEEIFNWTGSSMKSLFTTPAAGQIQYVKDGQDDAVNFVNQDQYSSQESLFTMSATTANIYAKGGQEGPVDYANLNDYSSLKSFFATPATATISHAKGAQEDQVEFSNQNHYSSVKSLFATPATATVSNLQGGQDYAISSAFPDNRCNQGETNMEDFTNKLFEDEVDGSGKNHFEFRSHQFDFSAGAAGTGHHEASGLKENSNSTDSGSFEKEKETQLKGPKTGDDNSF